VPSRAIRFERKVIKEKSSPNIQQVPAKRLDAIELI